MSMYIVNIAIRWTNGDLEGFGSSGLSEASARKRALDKAYRKAASFPGNSGFDVLTKKEFQALDVDQQDELQSDWDKETL